MGESMHRFVALFAGLTLALVGCSGSANDVSQISNNAEDDVADTQVPSGDGVYRAEVNGTIVELTFPIDELNSDAAAIVQHAADAGLDEPLTFVLLTITNNNDEAVAGCPPRLVTDTGETIAFQYGWSFVGDLREMIPDGNTELINEGVALYNMLLKGGEKLPGSVTTEIFVATEDVPPGGQFFSGAYTMETFGQGCDTRLSQ